MRQGREEDEEEGDMERGHASRASGGGGWQCHPDSRAVRAPGARCAAVLHDVHETIRRARQKRRQLVPDMPEVHILGEIAGVSGLGNGISVNFSIEFGDDWQLVEGESTGQTQTSYATGADDYAVLAHPLDLHLATNSLQVRSLIPRGSGWVPSGLRAALTDTRHPSPPHLHPHPHQGWPRMVCQVWKMDELGRAELVGYTLCVLPCVPGRTQAESAVWRPSGTLSEEMASMFVGGVPRLKSDALVSSEAWEKRLRLTTVGEGRLHLDVTVVARHWDKASLDA